MPRDNVKESRWCAGIVQTKKKAVAAAGCGRIECRMAHCILHSSFVERRVLEYLVWHRKLVTAGAERPQGTYLSICWHSCRAVAWGTATCIRTRMAFRMSNW